jgi:hypothetical protein
LEFIENSIKVMLGNSIFSEVQFVGKKTFRALVGSKLKNPKKIIIPGVIQ